MLVKKLPNFNEIHTARNTGGKAGKGKNKTSSVQLRSPEGIILATKRYNVAGGLGAKAAAVKYLEDLSK